ncbi:GNAT family N-acetyltransferase [Actinoplanes sp. NPDC051851]|uniref:GNAT family N-acetyltransferase n=1 Tax=Actinoplanes sp. NPDC051851 TaxID=3154753 RepID=UPI003440E4CE
MIEKELFVRWAAKSRDARVWRRPDAVVVASPGLAHWDRLVLGGDADAVAGLVREVMAEVDGMFRPFGNEDLVTAVVARVPELEMTARFAWMETVEPVRRGGENRPGWLAPGDEAEVAALIAESFPDSYAQPGDPDVRRWAGIRDAAGRLVAVAADAWSTDEIGFLAGVTTHPGARGRGLAGELCGFMTDELLREGRERTALIVDYVNTSAIATYRKLGYSSVPVAAARRAV